MARRNLNRNGPVLMHVQRMLVLCVFFVGSGCVTVKPKSSVIEFRVPVVLEAPLNTQLRVSAGERLYIRGALYEVDAYSLAGDVDSMMSGSHRGIAMEPFRFLIKQCDLVLSFQTSDHLYFCAPMEKVDSNHPSFDLRGVEYQVGIRRSKKDGSLQWFVDNSTRFKDQYTFGAWVWTRDVEPQDVQPVATRVRRVDESGEWVALYYAGFFDNKVHFDLEESSGQGRSRREFKFNVDPSTGAAVAAIKGFRLEIDSVDNVEMVYRWIALD